MKKLEDRTAIITGGGYGIGRQIALAYAREGRGTVSVISVVLFLIFPVLYEAQATMRPTTSNAEMIACRALETHTDDALKVTAVLFHQRDQAERSLLADLLHRHSGEMVEVRAGDGPWRRARLVRLKTCFGRGLLLLSAPVPFSDRAEFVLRLPPESAAH